MKFTKSNLDKLEPRKSNYYVMDDALDFFGIRIYPTAKKVFIIRIRQNGKAKTYKVANYSAISTAKAREQAGKLILRYQAGEDIKETEKIKKGLNKTLRDCIDDYLPTVKVTTQNDITRCIDFGWKSWIDKPIKNITETKLLKVYDQRAKEAKNRARLEMAYLRSIWNFHKKNLNLSDSPTAILNEDRKGWNTTGKKTRRLDFETASKFYAEIQKLSNRDRSFFLLIYYTGMRAIEAKNLKWDNINFNNKSLHITETKNGQPLNIPLSSQAFKLLESIIDKSPFVFSQVNRSGDITAMTSYSKSVAKLKKNGVLWSPHDSRRGFIVAGGVLAINSYMVKQLVNHYDAQDVHAGYQTYTVAELRESNQKIADHLEAQLLANNHVIEFKQPQTA